jgi:microcystin-dependent protein
MSGASDGLILYLTFDEIENGKVTDESANAYDGTVEGSPRVAPDDTFGSCLSFEQDGDSVSLPDMQADFANGLTLEAWALFSSLDNESPLIDLSGETGGDRIAFGNEGAAAKLILASGGDEVTLKADDVLIAGTWMHLTVTIDENGAAMLYRDGEVRQESVSLKPPSATAWQRNYVGKSNAEGGDYFRGKMATLRAYNRALTADEINKDLEADQSSSATFRTSYPISFRLHDTNDQPVLYITDNPAGLPLNVELSNTSGSAIEIAEPASALASAENFHFQLYFRPGTLFAADKITLLETGWDYKVEADSSNVSIYLLSTEGRTFAPDEQINLKLYHVRADGSSGAHGTRVELKYNHLNYAGDTVPLVGSRVQHLSVVNHSGEVNIPLHAWFKGSQLVLNDKGASANNLMLLIYNDSQEDAITWKPGSADGDSKFIISFDAEDDWALGTSSEVRDIDITSQGWSVKPEDAGKSAQWTLTHPTMTEIKAGDVIEVEITSVKSSLPSGLTNLYLRYKNVPGYWDGQLIRMIEKAPVQYVGSYVGVGTTNPRSELDLGAGVMSGAANDYQKAQFALSGGGTVSWEGPGGRLQWSAPFVAASIDQGTTFKGGKLEISQPAGGVRLDKWDTLYAIHQPGGDNSTISFQILNYSKGPNNAPSNWILLAAVNGTDNTVKLGTGAIVSMKSSRSRGDGVPCGTIVMWYGDSKSLPDGWFICDGKNGTPNLVDRFIVGAGSHYKPGDAGGQDSVQLTTDELPAHSHGGTTLPAGSHTHAYGLDTGSGGETDVEDYNPTGSKNLRNRWVNTSAASDHAHPFSTNSVGGGKPIDNRPAYYAVYFIMKAF